MWNGSFWIGSFQFMWWGLRNWKVGFRAYEADDEGPALARVIAWGLRIGPVEIRKMRDWERS